MSIISASRIFKYAAIYGFVLLIPSLFLESKISQDYPPAITHAEYFYGFTFLAIAFQWVFLIIARDPIKYKAMILPAILEKAGYGFTCVILCIMGKMHPTGYILGIIDILWMCGFAWVYMKLESENLV